MKLLPLTQWCVHQWRQRSYTAGSPDNPLTLGSSQNPPEGALENKYRTKTLTETQLMTKPSRGGTIKHTSIYKY